MGRERPYLVLYKLPFPRVTLKEIPDMTALILEQSECVNYMIFVS